MIAAPDYEALVQQARLANIEKLRGQMNSPQVNFKLASWAQRYGVEPEFVRYKTLTDDLFAVQFAADPAKQSIHQKIAATHIQKLPLIQGFESLPAGGDAAEFLISGLVVLGKSLKKATNRHGKSIDFRWGVSAGGEQLTVYVTHKHTTAEGGSQDNQFADVKAFLEEAQRCKFADTAFIALCDGPYYSEREYSEHPSRIAAMRADYSGPRSRICGIQELPGVYAELIHTWLAAHPRVQVDADLKAGLIALEAE